MKYILFPVLAVLVSCKHVNSASGQKDKDKDIINNNNSMLLSNIPECKNIEIDPKYDKGLPYDSLMSFMKYVKLETTDNNLVGDISQILFAQDKIIIVDSEISKTITVYDENGKFLNSVGRLGAGPTEYTGLGHVALTPDKSQIVVVSSGYYLKYYTIDGSFVKSEKIPFMFGHFEFISDMIIAGDYSGGNVISGNSKYKPRLIVSDIFGNVAYSAFQSYWKKNFDFVVRFALKRFDNKILYNPSYTDTIYQLTSNQYYPYYCLNIKGKIPFVIDERTTNNDMREHHKASPYFNGRYVEMEDAAMVHIPNSKTNFIIYSKKHDKTIYFNDDIDEITNIFFLFFRPTEMHYFKDNTMVVNVRAHEFFLVKDGMYHEDMYTENNKEMIDNLYNGLTEDENPILLFYKINPNL